MDISKMFACRKSGDSRKTCPDQQVRAITKGVAKLSTTTASQPPTEQPLETQLGSKKHREEPHLSAAGSSNQPLEPAERKAFKNRKRDERRKKNKHFKKQRELEEKRDEPMTEGETEDGQPEESSKDEPKGKGEAKLLCAKKDKRSALDDNHRRTPGPSIDGVFTIPDIEHAEFFILEVTGGPMCDDFEHYMGDRNKIAKNLKLMLRKIMTLRIDNPFAGLPSVKIYDAQIYKNELIIYSMTSPIINRYMFAIEKQFKFPTAPRLITQPYPQFMQDIWTLQRFIISGFKCIGNYLLEEVDDNKDTIPSNMSSPYVSPSKRK